jgi:hypothetical protein
VKDISMDYAVDPKLNEYIRAHAALYERALRRAMNRQPHHSPRFLLGMGMQACITRMFRKRMQREMGKV